MKILDRKLGVILRGSGARTDFIIADAKDADMGGGRPAPGPERGADGRPLDTVRPLAGYLDEIRAITDQGIVDVNGPTVADLAERYLREHVEVRCKPATVTGYRQVIGKHVLPPLGKVALSALDRKHVAELHYRLRKTPVAANDAVGTLSRMLNWAEAWGLVPAGSNPCGFVTRYRTRRPERFLMEEEFRRLGQALDDLEVGGRLPVYAVAAIRLLMLTGCRSGEVLGLRWEDVALERNEVRLRDSKTGPRVVPLSPAAARVLAGLPATPG